MVASKYYLLHARNRFSRRRYVFDGLGRTKEKKKMNVLQNLILGTLGFTALSLSLWAIYYISKK